MRMPRWSKRRSRDGGAPPPVVQTELTINGEAHRVSHAPDGTLLSVLRDRLRLTGAKAACGRGECGACTVLIDGVPRMSCITLVATVPGARVETIEGLAADTADLRAAFADHGGFQCGFCTPGQIVTASHLLETGAATDERAVRLAMSGNICRCTGYVGIVDAITATAADRLAARPRRTD